MGNPHIITTFPTSSSIKYKKSFKPNPNNLINEHINADYIVISQKPDYKNDPSWIYEQTRSAFIEENEKNELLDIFNGMLEYLNK